MELGKFDLETLRKLEQQVAERIAELEEEHRQEVLEKIASIASEAGISRDHIASHFGPKTKRTRRKATPKYCNPDDPSQTWSGRGRKPPWVEQALARGKALKELAIGDT